jgi:hypothetical protein
LSEPREEPGEQEIVETLKMLAEFSLTYWVMLQAAGPAIERLSQDDSLAAILLTTLAAAIGWPPSWGTPHHVEQLARQILNDLSGSASERSERC